MSVTRRQGEVSARRVDPDPRAAVALAGRPRASRDAASATPPWKSHLHVAARLVGRRVEGRLAREPQRHVAARGLRREVLEACLPGPRPIRSPELASPWKPSMSASRIEASPELVSTSTSRAFTRRARRSPELALNENVSPSKWSIVQSPLEKSDFQVPRISVARMSPEEPVSERSPLRARQAQIGARDVEPQAALRGRSLRSARRGCGSARSSGAAGRGLRRSAQTRLPCPVEIR